MISVTSTKLVMIDFVHRESGNLINEALLKAKICMFLLYDKCSKGEMMPIVCSIVTKCFAIDKPPSGSG